MSADWWQNFANNFAADLAPLLSLFGEQPTKQFLSETLTFVDIAIFSIAPIGVLTAVVSAIRVGGDPSLRAFIGRAQEGGAYAEAELCSSTSRDVCELYTTGGIARVFGRPKILEIVNDPSEDQESDTAGIYTFEEYSNLGEQTEWTEKKKRQNLDTSERKWFADHPNLSLNIGIKKLARPWFYLAAALGFFLQGAVLVFAALTTYVYPDTFKRDDTQIAVPAFPFTFAGTILLCTGVGLCATVVESSTNERSFKRNKKSKCRLHWIQPGGQVIGDQVFDSFAYSETSDNLLDEYTTSWKFDSEQATKKTLLVWAAITTTCVGFVLQFLGIRTLHSSVSVAQFVVMLVMSTVRALLRTQRLKKSDNQMGKFNNLYQYHELDWLAIKLARRGNDSNDGKWTWQIVPSVQGFSYETFDFSPRIADDAGDPSAAPPEASPMRDPPGNSWSELEKAFLKRARLARLTGAPSSNFNSIAYSAWDQTMIASRELASSLAKAIEGTMALFYSECTIGPRWKRASKICWSIPCGKDAIGGKPGSLPTLSKMPGYVRFTLRRQPGSTAGSWEADKSELEAALGLWLWSIRLKDRVKSSSEQVSEEFPDSFLPRSRIVLSHVETVPSAEESTSSAESISLAEEYTWGRKASEDSRSSDHTSSTPNDAPDLTPPFPAEHTRPAEANLKLWLRSRRLTLRQTTLKVPSDLSGPSTIVKPLKEYKEETFSEVSPDGLKEETTRPQRRRIFGQYLLPQSATSETQVRILEVPSQSSLWMMCAQEVFSAFLMSLSPIVHQIDGKTSINKGSDRVYLENQTVSNMIRNFAASGIGSEEDALVCVVPVLHNQGKLVHSIVFTESRDAADACRRRNEWANAEHLLLSALNLSFQAPKGHGIQYGPAAYTQYTKEQNECLLSLCELYRWALLGDRYSRLFGLRGFLSICKAYDFERFSKMVCDYRDVAIALCHNYEDDLAIRKLAAEFQAEIEKGKMSPHVSLKVRSDLIQYQDRQFPKVLKDGNLGATLYLLKEEVLSLCRYPSAIALAAQNGWATVLKYLLELGANPEEVDQDGLNYLHYASRCITNPKTFLKFVGNQGYLLNRTDRQGRTSLHLAVEADNKEIAGTLMDQFSQDPHQWDLSMTSSFEYAFLLRNAGILAFLVARMVQRLDQSSINIIWGTLMQIAIEVASSEDRSFLDSLVRCLVREENHTANECVKRTVVGFRETCVTVFQHFAEKKLFEFDFLRSTFYGHFSYDQVFSSNIVLSYETKINNITLTPLLEDLEKVTSLDDAGRSCLHYAIKGGNQTRIRELLNANRNIGINVEDRTGRTPLAYAFRSGDLLLTCLLRKHGAGKHEFPLRNSAIAAQYSDDYRLYFQDKGLRIRELVIDRKGNEMANLCPEIAVAKRYTPLAVICDNSHERKDIVYYISEENCICEAVNTSSKWLAGSLSHKKIKVFPESELAALRTKSGALRVFYQDMSGYLQDLRSTMDANEWQSPRRIRKIPLGTVFTVLATPEGVTRIIFQGSELPEEIYENDIGNHPQWINRVFAKIECDLDGYKSIRSITAPIQPIGEVFWLDNRGGMHETTLTDDGRWEDRTDADLVDSTRLCWRIQSERPGRIKSSLAVIGSERILFYQTRDGDFYGISKHNMLWRKERMAIPAYDS